MWRTILYVVAFAAATAMSWAQDLAWKLDADSTRWIRINALNQVWLRYNESNPGTMVNGEPKEGTFDIALRRTRLQVTAQLTERALLYVQFGQNNFTSSYAADGNRKFAAFFHDAFCEYRLSDHDEVKVGAGLTIANGLSRFSQPSVSTIMTTDVPVFAQATVDQTDQFSRKLSAVVRGQIGALDYRFSLSDPFVISSSGAPLPPISAASTFAGKGKELQYQGYVIWQFLDPEPHTTPYMAGTYLGRRSVFNIAAGAIHQPRAMWRTAGVDTTYENLTLLAVESFFDAPIDRDGRALNLYGGFFRYDFGKDYLRYNGIANPGNAPSGGNAFPMFGTGNVVYAQAGVYLPDLAGKGAGLMPYVTYYRADYDRLQGNIVDVYGVGTSLLLDGHRSKVSLDIQNRPTFTLPVAGDVVRGDRRNQVVLQYQLSI